MPRLQRCQEALRRALPLMRPRGQDERRSADRLINHSVARDRPAPHEQKQRFACSITLLLSWLAASRCSSGRSGGPFFARARGAPHPCRESPCPQPHRASRLWHLSGTPRVEVTVLLLAHPGLPAPDSVPLPHFAHRLESEDSIFPDRLGADRPPAAIVIHEGHGQKHRRFL